MRDDCAPHNNVEGPDDAGPPVHAYCDLNRLEDAVQRLQQTLETAGVTMQIQAQTRQAGMAQLRREPWWAFLTGVGFMGMLALSAWLVASPPRPVPPWQALPPVALVPEPVRPSDEPPSAAPAPDATLAPEADDVSAVAGL